MVTRRVLAVSALAVGIASAGVGSGCAVPGSAASGGKIDAVETVTVAVHAAPATRAAVGGAHARPPLAFEANRGQADPSVSFLARGPGYALFLTSVEAVLSLHRPSVSAETTVIRMKVLGANARSKATGIGEQPGKTNYFV